MEKTGRNSAREGARALTTVYGNRNFSVRCNEAPQSPSQTLSFAYGGCKNTEISNARAFLASSDTEASSSLPRTLSTRGREAGAGAGGGGHFPDADSAATATASGLRLHLGSRRRSSEGRRDKGQ